MSKTIAALNEGEVQCGESLTPELAEMMGVSHALRGFVTCTLAAEHRGAHIATYEGEWVKQRQFWEYPIGQVAWWTGKNMKSQAELHAEAEAALAQVRADMAQDAAERLRHGRDDAQRPLTLEEIKRGPDFEAAP